MRNFTNSFIFSFSCVVDSTNDYIIRFRTPEHCNSDLFGIIRNPNGKLADILSARNGSVIVPCQMVQDDSVKHPVQYVDANDKIRDIEAWEITSLINDKGYEMIGAYSWLANFGKEAVTNA